eukprot:2982-Heterococcus_DN1.PRE.2
MLALQRPAKSIELTYDDEEPIHGFDITVTLKDDGIKLHFDPASQKLRLITVTDLSLLTLSKGRTVFSGPKCQPTFQLVYRLFGPTFPGRHDAVAGTYILQYTLEGRITVLLAQNVQHTLHWHESVASSVLHTALHLLTTTALPQKFASLLQASTAAAVNNTTATAAATAAAAAAAYVPLEWPDGSSPVAVSLAVHAKGDSSSGACSSSRQSSLLTALPTDDWTAVGQVTAANSNKSNVISSSYYAHISACSSTSQC